MTAHDTSTATVTLPLIDLNRDRREERRRVFRRSQRHGAAILAIVVAAGAALVPLTLQVVALSHEIRTTEGQSKEESVRLQSMTAASAQLDGRIDLWEQLGQTQRSRRTWGAILPSLASCLPEDVFLQQVQINGQDKDVEIQVQGSARTMRGLRTFTAALAGSAMFAQVHLDEATADKTEGRGGLTFRLTGPITTGTTAGSL